jgi:hypothetical protein
MLIFPHGLMGEHHLSALPLPRYYPLRNQGLLFAGLSFSLLAYGKRPANRNAANTARS